MKHSNPLFRKTAQEPIDPEVVDDEDAEADALMETFPGQGQPLSVRERKRLNELETVVTSNFRAFYEVGCALREICASTLYRETHPTFSDYVKDLWDMARRTAYQYIEAVDIVDRLIPFAPEGDDVRHGAQSQKMVPQNERQARALAKYPEEQQIQIWREAVKTADGRITAAHIKQTARRLHGKAVKERIQKTKEKTTRSPAVIMSDRFRAAFNEFLDAIDEERLNEWRTTSRDEVLRHLEGLIQAVGAPL